MEKKDFSNIGNEIKDALNEAFETNDFSKLSEQLSSGLEQAVSEMKFQVGDATKKATGFAQSVQKTWQEQMQKQYTQHQKMHQEQEYQTGWNTEREKSWTWTQKENTSSHSWRISPQAQRHQEEQAMLQEVKKERYLPVSISPLSILSVVFGGICTAGGGIPSIVFTAIILAAGTGYELFWLIACLFLPITVVGAVLLKKGIASLTSCSRFRKYIACIGIKQICAIKTLSQAVGKSEKMVRSELKKMIARGWFRQGYLDEEESCLMVTNETYQLYLEAKERSRQAQKEQAEYEKQEALKKEEEERKQKKQTEKTKEQREAEQKINEIRQAGKEYMEAVHQANDDLPDPIISGKLERLETVIGIIYRCLEKHPEKLDSMRRFTGYYIPTTLKLVEAYRTFELEEMQTERIVKAKAEISESLDMICKAFEQMADDLYETDTLDITTDIQVLKSLLAQDGLGTVQKK